MIKEMKKNVDMNEAEQDERLGQKIVTLIERDVNDLYSRQLIEKMKIDQINCITYSFATNKKEKTIDKTIDKNNEKKNTIKIILSNKPAKIRNNISSGVKKRKEANEYYVGGDSFVNNNSTLIDPNEYYLNVLESQQLLVNSG